MTNADFIRSMTDEELYNFIQSALLGDIDYGCTFCNLCKEHGNALGLDCDGCLKWWLTLDVNKHPQGLNYWNDIKQEREQNGE